jgi:hypothetical protein
MNISYNISLLLLMLSSLFSCKEESKKSPTLTIKKQDTIISTFTTKNLQGSWTSFREQRNYTNCKQSGIELDSPYDSHSEIINWVVNGDSIWAFDYPCQFLGAKSFQVKSGSIYFDGNKKASAQINNFGNGSSDLFQIIIPGDNKNPVVTEVFQRDTFDLKTIEMLKHDSVNMECLLGKMKIVTHIQPEDGEAYDVKFPIHLPKYIDIKNKDFAQTIYTKKQIMIPIDGINKLFYIDAIEWNDFGYNYPGDLDWQTAYEKNHGQKHYIVIHPAEWWKGEMFSVSYEQE